MLKILHLLASSQPAGAQRVAIDLASGLAADYSVGYASPKGPIAELLQSNQIPFLPLHSMSLHEITRVVSAFQADIVHAHDFRASTVAALLPKKARLVSHLHSNWPWARSINFRTLAYRAALSRLARVIVVSRSIVDEYAFQRALRRKARVIANVVHGDRITMHAQETEHEPFDLGFVGRLEPQKNPILFLRIVKLVKNQIGRVRAVIVGSGTMESECRCQIAELGLVDDVLMAGYQRNPYTYMRCSRMLAVPSKHEGFGLVALEAMLLGVPVLASATGGLMELVNSSGGGAICQSPEEFATKAVEWLKQGDLRRQLGARARTWAQRHSDVNAYLDQFRDLYASLFES
ncbi:MAG: glycosyltransferase [Pirellulales bacterium]|nr:glycosyltransferase [Pirellulales bacterium]